MLPPATSEGQIISLAIGSGLAVISSAGDSSLVLALTDRGPNVSVGALDSGAEQVVFPVPNFSPAVYPIIIEGSKISKTLPKHYPLQGLRLTPGSTIPLRSESGIPLLGLPTSSSEEAPHAASLEPLAVAPAGQGVDPEAIAFDTRRKQLWIAEEYGPSILAINLSTGRITRQLTPDDGLPAITRHRAKNRGFEGLAYLPNDYLAAALQSPIVDPATSKAEPFVRLVLVPADTTSREHARTHAIPVPAAASEGSYKIGELAALSETKLLALESYQNYSDEKHYHLILLDLKGAIPIDSHQFIASSDKIAGAVTRSVVIDFADFKWASGKIEGLAVVDRGRTIVIAKDNDFGIRSKKSRDGSNKPLVSFEEAATQFLILRLSKSIEELLSTR